jgi:hypothetical protein
LIGVSLYIVECAKGCGGGHKPVDDKLLWIPQECDTFGNMTANRTIMANDFQKKAVGEFKNTIKKYYAVLMENGMKRGHKGITENVSDQS